MHLAFLGWGALSVAVLRMGAEWGGELERVRGVMRRRGGRLDEFRVLSLLTVACRGGAKEFRY